MESEQAPPTLIALPDASSRSRAGAARLELTWLDRMAATAMLGDDDPELSDLRDLCRSCAEALAGADRDAARIRLLAREVAIARVTLDLATTTLGVRLRAGDERGAVNADRLAAGAAKRLVLLLAEHRASCAMERRTIVAIANAGVVNVEGVK